MSMFKLDVGVGNLDGGDLAPVRPVVDTGDSALDDPGIANVGAAD